MKTNQQTSDIFDDIRLFHNKSSDFFDHLHRSDEKGELKILLDYLTQHEKLREKTIQKYKSENSSKAKDAWFKYVPIKSASSYLKSLEVDSNMSVQDVVQIAMDLDDQLIELYKRLVGNSKNTDIKNIFSSLLLRLKQEKKNLVRDALWLNDF